MSVEWLTKTMNMTNNPPISLDHIQNESINQINTLNTQQNSRLTAVETLNTQQDSRLTAVETTNSEQSTAITEIQSNIQAIGAQLPDGVVPLETIENSSIDSLLT